MDKDYNTSYEPMDIDLSSHNNSAMDISYGSGDEVVIEEKCSSPVSFMSDVTHDVKEQYPIHKDKSCVKKFHLTRPPTRKHSGLKNFFSVLLVTLIAIVIAYYSFNLECCPGLDLKELQQKLSGNIYGQDNALHLAIKALETNVRIKILFLFGGTGVGKTYFSSLLIEERTHYVNTYHYTMPSFINQFSPESMLGLTICEDALFIVDDLTSSDMHIKKNIKEVINKSENLGKNLTVILIFNCDSIAQGFVKKCDNNFGLDLEDHFNDINVYKTFIRFEPLSQVHLRRCIENELGGKVMDTTITTIMNNFDVNLDGCKSVHRKVKMFIDP